MIDAATTEQVIRFHGHLCPGLALGVRAAEVALAEIGPHSTDEEVVAVVETDMCGVDAIQFLTGCTFGKGNLVHLDHGKNVYTFIRRSDDRAVRVSTRKGGWALPRSPELEALGQKMGAGKATAADEARFWELQAERSRLLLEAPLDDLYDVREVDAEVPRRARVFTSVDCAECGEPTMETRLRLLDGRQLCLPCFEAAFSSE